VNLEIGFDCSAEHPVTRLGTDDECGAVVRCDLGALRGQPCGNHHDRLCAKVRCPLREIVEALADVGLVQFRRALAVNAARVQKSAAGVIAHHP
jgi:hypothetical protein